MMNVSFSRSKLLSLLAIALLAVALVSMQGEAADAAKDAPPAAPPVQVKTLEAAEVTLWSEYSGRLRAVDYVELRPRVSGAITAIKFEDSAMVKEGQELFTIDTRPFEAEVAKARAALNSAYSQAKLAQVELDRAKSLLAESNVSQSVYDQRASAYQVTTAAIGQANAALSQAQLNLEYAHVKAPISGRISRAEITVGNVVEAGANAPVLSTILDESRIYAEFEVDEQTYLKIFRQTESGKEKLPVQVTLAGDSKVYQGKIHSFDNRLNADSGTIRARALIENCDGAIIPGMYAKVQLQNEKGSHILLPEAAIGTDQSKKFVYVVDAKNAVQYREVQLGQQQDGARVVLEGVKAGERVALTGLAMLRPGMAVTPMESKDSGSGIRDSEEK